VRQIQEKATLKLRGMSEMRELQEGNP